MAPVPAAAADFAGFSEACATARTFLVHDAAAGSDGGAALHILCPCLEMGFARYSQAEVDALTADLAAGSSIDGDLRVKASAVLEACFNSDILSAMFSFPKRPASGR